MFERSEDRLPRGPPPLCTFLQRPSQVARFRTKIVKLRRKPETCITRNMYFRGSGVPCTSTLVMSSSARVAGFREQGQIVNCFLVRCQGVPGVLNPGVRSICSLSPDRSNGLIGAAWKRWFKLQLSPMPDERACRTDMTCRHGIGGLESRHAEVSITGSTWVTSSVIPRYPAAHELRRRKIWMV